MPKNSHFSQKILTWFEISGRHDLPWQQHKKEQSDIYAVWLSEIMLQQTQVSTVIPYFQRFIAKFPTVIDLAAADWDEVANLWAGLGYYARAKNLHQGAKQVVDFIKHTGNFPQSVDQWQTIKGVGQSTAGAIVAMGVRGFGVICDGNVKRVLSRWAMISDDINKTATQKQLWQLAQALTPKHDSGKYAQAMMDLGATICTKNRPKCTLCPISADCQAYQKANPINYPVKNKSKEKPKRYSFAFQLIQENTAKTLWLKRQSVTKQHGIWEGLWCLPLLDSDVPFDGDTYQPSFNQGLGNCQLGETVLFEILKNKPLPTSVIRTIKHTLSHFHWYLTLVELKISPALAAKIEQILIKNNVSFRWQACNDGFAKPKAMINLLQ